MELKVYKKIIEQFKNRASITQYEHDDIKNIEISLYKDQKKLIKGYRISKIPSGNINIADLYENICYEIIRDIFKNELISTGVWKYQEFSVSVYRKNNYVHFDYNNEQIYKFKLEKIKDQRKISKNQIEKAKKRVNNILLERLTCNQEQFLEIKPLIEASIEYINTL